MQKEYKKNGLQEELRYPKTLDELIERIKNAFNINGVVNKIEHEELKELLKRYGYKRIRNTFVYIYNNFNPEKIEISDMIQTFMWEKKFRNFLKHFIEDVEISFSNAILAILATSTKTWSKDFPNIEIVKFFVGNQQKRIANLMLELRSRFWNHKEEILDFEENNNANEKVKLNQIFIWDCFDKATFGDLLTFYAALRDNYKVKTIEYFIDKNIFIDKKLLQNFEDGVKFIKFLRNKVYHNEQLFSINITRHLTDFNEMMTKYKTTSFDKIIYGLAFSLPTSFARPLFHKVQRFKKHKSKYLYITKIADHTNVVDFNIWNQRLI